MALRAAAEVSLLMGQCVPTSKSNASKLRIKRLELDTNLLMYFRKDEYIYITDPNKNCKTGDIVLVKKLPEKLTKLVTHELVEIVHKLGDVTCPLTNKKVVGTNYRDDIEFKKELYGKSPTAFDYGNAPPRGWQEGKRDFTDKPTYKKFHVFPEEDPYTVY
ncbi:mitochondrial ribosomal protein S17 isoform X2 [Arctopsyche grandis]|uniref:mitochondrial ribosomal protein S17 isoform X2 n=1 Tax=Arctopsyche grandis TaxID=121162 RepID=UPI00406D9BED